MSGGPFVISIVIPARDEDENLPRTVGELEGVLSARGVPYEIVLVDDHSADGTRRVMESLAARSPRVQWVSNEDPGGFGYAVRRGLEQSTGAGVCIYMADASDSPDDVVAYYDKLKEGYDCVFGSRFMSGGRVTGYPIHKLVINRLVNWFVRILFALRTNDTTNAFKAYRREVIQGVQPLLSRHFNLTVELPLKAVIRGYSYAVVPISWRGRVKGFSKLKIKEMGSRYLFIVAYVFLERFLSRGDYKRTLPALQPITETRPPRN